MLADSFKNQTIKSITDLDCWIKQNFIKQLSKNKKDIILLNGPMGVGKTQWLSLFVKQLLANQPLAKQSLKDNKYITSSPSFSLHNIYKVKDLSIHHFDLYRLNVKKDLESFGFWDVFKQDQACIVIEWSNKFSGLDFFPNWQLHNINMDFKTKNSTDRTLTYCRL